MIRTTASLVLLLAVACSSPPPPAPADVAAPPSNASKTPSGLAYLTLVEGTGTQRPTIDDSVTVHYVGWQTTGRFVDSSYRRGSPATFAVRGVIRGWTEALQLMVVGQKIRVWIPAELAYEGREGPQGMLVFEIDLLAIQPGS